MSSDLLDPARAAAAGARHGQMASGMAGGGLAISCQKMVEDASRTTVLIAPGLFRIDVRPVEDTLQVISRNLHLPPGRWEIVDEKALTEYGKRGKDALGPHKLEFAFFLDIEPKPLQGRVIVASTVDWDRGLVHFVAHAVVREVSA